MHDEQMVEKAKQLMKEEGTYATFLRHVKRNQLDKAQVMMEELLNRRRGEVDE